MNPTETAHHHLVDMEQWVVGSCATMPDLIEPVREVVKSDDFYRLNLGRAFNELCIMADEGMTIDEALVAQRLVDKKIIAKKADVLGWTIGIPALANAASYAKAIKAASIRRRINRIGQRILQADDLNGEVTTSIAELEALLHESTPSKQQINEMENFMLTTPPKTDYIIEDGLLPPKSIMFIGGLPKTNKTMLATNMALCIASGQHFLGRHIVKEPKKVLILQQEMPHYSVWLRMQKMAGGHPGLANMYIPESGRIDLEIDDDGYLKLRRILKDLDLQNGVVVIDPLYKFFVGDENSGEDAKRFTDYIDRLRDEFDVSFVIIHHFRKPGIVKTSQSTEFSGSAVFWRWGDTFLKLEADEDTKGRRKLTYELRHEENPDPLILQLNEKLWLDVVDQVDPSEKVAREMDVYFVVKQHFQGDASRAEILEYFKEAASAATIKNRLSTLVSARQLHRYQEGREARFTVNVPNRFGVQSEHD